MSFTKACALLLSTALCSTLVLGQENNNNIPVKYGADVVSRVMLQYEKRSCLVVRRM
jgi:hypothetical protein